MKSPAEYLDWIASESDAFARTLRADALDNRVPGCPDWSLRELAWHLGRVQRFWADIVREGVDEFPDSLDDERVPGPRASTELNAWMRASTTALLDALRSTPWETPAWAWWKEDHTAGAIGRHQVQEAAVHRWDAQSAVGPPESLPSALADDGVDEFIWLCRQLRAPAAIAFHATDTNNTYRVTNDEPAVVVTATASELVLLLHGRIAIDDVSVSGDRALLANSLVPVA